MKAFNRFTITSGNETVSVHNIAFDPTSAFTEGEPFGWYIAIGPGGATVTDTTNPALSETLCVKATELAEYNVDCATGEAFAVFTVRLTDDDVAAGKTVGAAGLSYSPGGAPLADFASFGPMTKIAGEDIVIKAEIRLTLTSETMRFTAGDNRLVRVLLGIEGMGGASFELAHGTNYHTAAVMPRNESGIDERVAVTPVINADGIGFSCEFTAEPYEILLLMNNKVVMRGFAATGAHVEKCTATVRENFGAEIGGAHVTSVLNVKSGGEAVGTEYDFPKANRVTADCPQIIKGRLPKNAAFLSEPSGAYFAVITDKDVTVYGASGGTPAPLYKTSNPGGKTVLLSDGGLMTACGKLYRYKLGEDGRVGRVIFDGITDAADVAAVVNPDGKVDFMLLAGSAITHRTETEDGATTSTSVGVKTDDYVFGRSGVNSVYYASKSAKKYYVYCHGTRNSPLETRLRSAVAGSVYTLKACFDQWVRVRSVNMSVEYVMPFAKSAIFVVGDNERTIFCGNYCLTFEDGEMKRCLTLTTGTKLSIAAIGADEGVPEPKDAIVAGNYILALYDGGEVRTLYPVPYGRAIYCPDLAANSSITFDAVVLDDPKGDAESVTVNLKLTR